jgi:hypothetical protein
MHLAPRSAALRSARFFPSVFVALAVFGATHASVSAIELYHDDETGRFFDLSMYAQPYLMHVQDPCIQDANDPSVCNTLETPDGFGLERSRIVLRGGIRDRAEFLMELKSIPDMQLLESQVRLRVAPGLYARFGRYRVPFSQQELISESRLQLTRSTLITNTPGRQLGTSLRYEWPAGLGSLPAQFLIAEAGMFNGESDKARSPVYNIDSHFLYGGRIEINPFGHAGPRTESDNRPLHLRHNPILSVGASYAYHQSRASDRFDEESLGADLLFKWHGASLYGEWFRRERDYVTRQDGIDQYSYGWNVQAGLMIPGSQWTAEHLELGARLEYFDPRQPARRTPEDISALRPASPGAGPANTDSTQNQQAQFNIVGALNYYVNGSHDLKFQFLYTHRRAGEDYRESARDPLINADVDDDTVMLLGTFRF